MKDAAFKSQEDRKEFVAIQLEDEDAGYDRDVENQPQYLFMELKSTTSFKDIDIDQMLEHTTFDDFMKGLYVNKVTQAQPKEGAPSDFQAMLNQIVSGSQDGE